MQKLDFAEAVSMLDDGYYIMHLDWLYRTARHNLIREHEDCSHFLVQAGVDWRKPGIEIILVLEDVEAECKYMDSRAGVEKYGKYGESQDKSYQDLIIENQLLKRAIVMYLHEIGSPLSYFRNSLRNAEYWTSQNAIARIVKIGKGLVRNLDVMCRFSHVLWRAVDRRNPPSNDELRVIIDDFG